MQPARGASGFAFFFGPAVTNVSVYSVVAPSFLLLFLSCAFSCGYTSRVLWAATTLLSFRKAGIRAPPPHRGAEPRRSTDESMFSLRLLYDSHIASKLILFSCYVGYHQALPATIHDVSPKAKSSVCRTRMMVQHSDPDLPAQRSATFTVSVLCSTLPSPVYLNTTSSPGGQGWRGKCLARSV